MTPLEAIGYAFAALIVSPVAIGLLILVLIALLVIVMLIGESRKAQVAVLLGALLWLGVLPLIQWARAPSVPKPPQSCTMRCESYMYEDARLECLEDCFKAQKLIQENEGVKP